MWASTPRIPINLAWETVLNYSILAPAQHFRPHPSNFQCFIPTSPLSLKLHPLDLSICSSPTFCPKQKQLIIFRTVHNSIFSFFRQIPSCWWGSKSNFLSFSSPVRKTKCSSQEPYVNPRTDQRVQLMNYVHVGRGRRSQWHSDIIRLEKNEGFLYI